MNTEPSLHELTACIGSNFPDADLRILSALRFLEESTAAKEVITTGVYRLKDSSYSNAIMRWQTALSSDEVRELCKKYERTSGRTPESKARGEISIDIDIVIDNGEILRKDYFTPYFTQGLAILENIEKTITSKD